MTFIVWLKFSITILVGVLVLFYFGVVGLFHGVMFLMFFCFFLGGGFCFVLFGFLKNEN